MTRTKNRMCDGKKRHEVREGGHLACLHPVRRRRTEMDAMPKRGQAMPEEQKQKIAAALRSRGLSPTKRCPACGQTKSRGEFGVRKNGYSRSHCRACELAGWRTWQKANPDKVRATNRRTSLKRWLGLTEREYERLLNHQNARCAICRCSPAEAPKSRLHVDHCHATGLIRGLLCSPCNTAIGLLREDPSALAAAIAYLKAPPGAVFEFYASGNGSVGGSAQRAAAGQEELFEVAGYHVGHLGRRR
jgi:hypothetical protein